jgi:hypothetical protein
VLFEDFTHVKFYRRSFFDIVEDEGGRFDGFSHVDDWVPQRLVTATGPKSRSAVTEAAPPVAERPTMTHSRVFHRLGQRPRIHPERSPATDGESA